MKAWLNWKGGGGSGNDGNNGDNTPPQDATAIIRGRSRDAGRRRKAAAAAAAWGGPPSSPTPAARWRRSLPLAPIVGCHPSPNGGPSLPRGRGRGRRNGASGGGERAQPR